jgi:hypothetical protein
MSVAHLRPVRHGYTCHLFQRMGLLNSVTHGSVVRHGYVPYAWRTAILCATDVGA